MKKYNKKKIIMYFLIVFIAFLSLSYASYYFYSLKFHNLKFNNVSYKSETKPSYKVYLFDNDYFDVPYLEEGRTYISSLINYIDIDFSNVTNFDTNVSGKYIYYINATVSADKGNSSYWSKTYTLSDMVTGEYSDTNEFKIDTNVKIDYQKYNDLLAEFKKEYGLTADGNLKVELKIESVTNTDILENDIQLSAVSEVNIPLTQQVIDLSIDASNNTISNTVTDEYYDNDLSSFNKLVFIVMCALDICLLCMLIFVIYMLVHSNSKYTKTLNKILSSYDSIIVNVNELPNLGDMSIIEVNDFTELIDAHNEVRMPINFYEELKNRKSVFVLVSSNNMAWIYKLYNEEIKRKGMKK